MTCPALALLWMIQMSGPPSTSSSTDAVVDTADDGDEAVAAGADAADLEKKGEEDRKDDDTREEGGTTDEGEAGVVEQHPMPDATSGQTGPAATNATPVPTEREPPQRGLELDEETAWVMWFAGMGVTALSMLATALTPLVTIPVAILGGVAINDIGKERTGFEGTWWTLAAAVASPIVCTAVAFVVTLLGLWVTIPPLRAAGFDTDSGGAFGILPNELVLRTMLGWGAAGLVVGVGVGGYMQVFAYALTATSPQE